MTKTEELLETETFLLKVKTDFRDTPKATSFDVGKFTKKVDAFNIKIQRLKNEIEEEK